MIEMTAEDLDAVLDWGDDQREGTWVNVVCPVCEEKRTLTACDAVVGRCGGRGFRDK